MTSTLRVAELDFDTIKINLKQYLSSQPEFTDYDFEGSGLSVIMNLLAYNTHYNAVIGNMLIEEMFLDTAVKPTSIALIAKRLGYTPMSMRAPSANISIEVFPPDNPTSLVLGKNAQFNTTVGFNSTPATFVTRDAYTITPVGGRYIFPNITLYEGANYTFRYIVDTSVQQRFEIPSTSVDTTLLKVTVQDSTSSTNIVEWSNYSTIIDLKSDTKAYFTKINEKGNYEIYFGDGIFGKSIVTGNVVSIGYISTNGPVANGASSFTFGDSISGYTSMLITAISPASGGSNAETLDSVRINAQNTTFAQKRAVTTADFATLIGDFMPVASVSVWGGETLTPPVYGKIFISIVQPNTTTNLTDAQKSAVLTYLQNSSTMGIIKEIVDPEYVNISINTDIKYDRNKTTLGPSTIITNVTNNLIDWGNTTLGIFNADFEYSKLVARIDNIDPSFIANDTNITFSKTKSFIKNVNTEYAFNFYCSIRQSNSIETNIVSTAFRTADDATKDVYLGDDSGVLYTYYVLNSRRIVLNSNVGTVDYANGIIAFSTKMVSGGSLNSVTVTVKPDNTNTIKSRNNVIVMNSNDIKVTLRTI